MGGNVVHKTITGLLVFILFLLIGIVGGFIYVTQQHASAPSTDRSPDPSVTSRPNILTPAPTMTFAPPQESQTGIVTTVSGDGGILKRYAREYTTAQEEDAFVIGEAARTLADTQMTLTFENFGKITLGEQSHIASVSLLRSNFTVEQTKGEVAYVSQTPDSPISVRYRGAVMKIGGTSIISVSDDGVANVVAGTEQTTMALLDENNNTKVRTIEAGETAILDTGRQTIEVLEPEEDEEEQEAKEEKDEPREASDSADDIILN
jgi:hypothetical protein